MPPKGYGGGHGAGVVRKKGQIAALERPTVAAGAKQQTADGAPFMLEGDRHLGGVAPLAERVDLLHLSVPPQEDRSALRLENGSRFFQQPPGASFGVALFTIGSASMP